MITDDSSKALVSYRLESDREKLNAAEDLLEKCHYKDSVGQYFHFSYDVFPNFDHSGGKCKPLIDNEGQFWILD